MSNAQQLGLEDDYDDDDYYDDYFDDDDFDECGMGSDGQCSMAGSEQCDFECPLKK
jgi:hypothetical protein